MVFLDEPSSGMDPVARRAMWNLITDAVLNHDMSVVLTTHSMEECEALCSRVGVMVAGSLVCLGSIQHIKSRFGSGTSLLNSHKELHMFVVFNIRVLQALSCRSSDVVLYQSLFDSLS